jgi:hypothetical protein
LTKKGADAFTSKKPLVATGELRDGIRYQVAGGGNSVEIGTNRFAGEWSGGAAVHQFGDKKGRIPPGKFEFETRKTEGGSVLYAKFHPRKKHVGAGQGEVSGA